MKRTLIANAFIVNEGETFPGSIVIEGEQIAEILKEGEQPSAPCSQTIEAKGYYLIPGVIDEHVHFREPGLTQKADIAGESRAAAAGGVTSIMDMPNTSPLTTSLEAFEEKMELLGEKSLVNYACYLGATNNNYSLFSQLDPHRVAGIKLFMGSSTGNMLVDESDSLMKIFNGTDLLIAAHCESQPIISKNSAEFKKRYGITAESKEDVPVEHHPDIRSTEACYESSKLAVSLAEKTGARLHIMHITTGKELEMLDNIVPLSEKRITAEVCTPHLLFTADDYARYGTRIKCNPAVKAEPNRTLLRAALNFGIIDTIGTDHAPHLLSDKLGGALKAASGIPVIQYSLPALLELTNEKVFTIEMLVEKMCHAPATIYRINNRGYIRKGYQADLVLLNPNGLTDTSCIYSKCQWTPFEGRVFQWAVDKTFVNGNLVYSDKTMNDTYRGQALRFR